MVAGAFKVSAESLSGVSRDLNTGAAQIQDELDTLMGKVEGLKEFWEGSGNASFSELYQQLDTAGRKVHESLLGISSMLDKASGHYDNAETSATKLFKV